MNRPAATIAQPTTPDESTNVSAAEHCRPSARPGWLKIFGAPSRLFAASVFAANVPFVLADSGGDFSNNLFSDLAPVLALFGEQVAKQYMSHSMSKIEDLIFAMAPLGIITAITSAIRVGGPSYLKAIIGRAREGKGVVEVELMSSTSTDVCELWNGDGVSRVLGSADPTPIVELFYLERTRSREPAASEPIMPEPAAPEPAAPEPNTSSLTGPWGEHATQIYDFRAGRVARILQSNISDTMAESDAIRQPNTSDTVDENDKIPPNLGLNIGRPKVCRLELILVATVGIILQVGVLVFAGASAQPPLNQKLTKDNKRVLFYAFPTMAAGTIALVTGMFFCAYIIERSTDEENWTVAKPGMNKQAKVAWIQRGAVVNDQQFDSYFIQRGGSETGIGRMWKTVSYVFPKEWLNTNTELHVCKSRRAAVRQLDTLTVLAASVSTIGFIAQFTGLRGLNWTVTIAQLAATGIMTILRAAVRRGMVLDEVQHEIIHRGYELEWTAMKIKDCHHWAAVTWGLDDMAASATSNRLAMEVVEARCRLGELFQWENQWKNTVDLTVQAIEVAMNFFTSSDITLTNMANVDEFVWQLIAEVHERPAAAGAEFEAIRMELSRKWLSEGRGWGDWRVDKVNRRKIEAALGLWMLHFKKSQKSNPSGTRSLRILDIEKAAFDRWIRREAETTEADSSGTAGDETLRIVGNPSNIRDRSDWLAVISETPLEAICGQLLLSAFIAGIAEKIPETIGGIVRVRGSQQTVKASFGWRNSFLDKLAEEVERVGLATTIEEALLCIVPPLEKAGKLPTNLGTTQVFEDTAKEISTYIKGGRFDLAEPLLLWLLDTAETSATKSETEGKWDDACRVLVLLCKTCDKIDGGEEYSSQAEEALGLFCERHLMFLRSTDNTHGKEDTLDLLHATLGDGLLAGEGDVWATRLTKWDAHLENWNPGEVDLNIHDSSGKTPLILASIEGQATTVAQLLKRNADARARDNSGKNAVHYAAARNSIWIVRNLLRNAPSRQYINAEDDQGRTALGVASEGGSRTMVALLIFYGANIKTKDRDRWTPLHGAASSGHEATVRLLLDSGTPIESRSSTGSTALHEAASNGHEATVRLLLGRGARIEAASAGGSTALRRAASNGHEAMVRLLLDRGAQVEAASNDGSTALHWSASNGHEVTVRLLLDRSARIEAASSTGWTALHWAAKNGHEAMVRLLLNRGAQIEAVSYDGSTALHGAASNGHEATVRLLLDRGAQIEAVSGDGSTALHGAASNGHEATVQLLLDRGAPIEAASSTGWTALHGAASNGHEAMVRLLLDCGARIEVVSSTGWTALHWAAKNGHEATVRLLVDRGARIEATSDNGSTALHWATSNGHEAMVRLLLDCGVHIEAASSTGWTALHGAAENGREATVRLLLDRGAPIGAVSSTGWTALHWAALNGHEATVRLLLNRGVQIEAVSDDGLTALHGAASNGHEATVLLLLDRSAPIEAASSTGSTALHGAAENGREATVRLLLDRGAPIGAVSSTGWTALHWAAKNGYEATVRLLLDRGAQIEVVSDNGLTALHGAASNGHEATVLLLLDRGAPIEAASSTGWTALHWAASKGHEATVRLLLDSGAPIEATSSTRWTALHGAASNGHEATVRLLLDRGAPIQAASYTGWTALHWAAENGHEATVRVLLDCGAPIGTVSSTGWTALHWAAKNGHEATVRLLLDRGAPIETASYTGWTALHWAAENGHEATVRLLLDRGAQIEAASDDRSTALLHAASNGHEATVQLLLDRGATDRRR